MKYFSILVLFILITPLFHMNTSEITEQENRTLAKFPVITKKDKPNYEFGKEFESWLGDRFWGRDKLIDARFQTMYKINGRIENDKAFVGDDGWMFPKWGTTNYLSLEEQRKKIETDIEILKMIDNKLQKKKLSLYILLNPNREQLYQKYWERYYTPKPKLDYGDEIINALKNLSSIHIIYPKKAFIKAAQENKILFFKTDIHRTQQGHKIIFKETLDEVKKQNSLNYDLHYEIKMTSRGSHHYTQDLGINDTEKTGTLIEKIDFINFKNKTIYSDTPHERSWPNVVIKSNSRAFLKKNAYFVGQCDLFGLNDILSPVFQKTVYLKFSENKDLTANKLTVNNLKKYLKIDRGDSIFIPWNPRIFSTINEILAESGS